jgi:hypothetical protein
MANLSAFQALNAVSSAIRWLTPRAEDVPRFKP